VYRMPKKNRKTDRKTLLFQVPLIRLVVPLDPPHGKLRTSSVGTSSCTHLHTLLRLIRIVTPLEDLLTAKAPPLTPGSDQTPPVQAKKKKYRKNS
jgi:hypothetical protein